MLIAFGEKNLFLLFLPPLLELKKLKLLKLDCFEFALELFDPTDSALDPVLFLFVYKNLVFSIKSL